MVNKTIGGNMIEMGCPRCGRWHRFKDQDAGDAHKCSKCGKRFRIDGGLYRVEMEAEERRSGPVHVERVDRDPDFAMLGIGFLLGVIVTAGLFVLGMIAQRY